MVRVDSSHRSATEAQRAGDAIAIQRALRADPRSDAPTR